MNIEYERLEWEDYPSIETPLSAENLNHLEEGIAALYSERYELQSNIAYVEDGETASKEYLTNSYLMKDGLFYKVTKPIYYGDTFDSGEDGNITHVNISSQFGSGGGGSTGCVELTLAQYNALSEESKMADVIYLITDTPDNYLADVFGDFASLEHAVSASKPYEAGDYLVYANKFYLVSDDIAKGDTIIPNTNVEQTTVGDEIKSVRNTSSSNYCKMPDGTLMEWGVKSVTTNAGPCPLGYYGSAVVEFSPVFASAPMVTVSANENAGFWNATIYNVSVSQATAQIAGDQQNATRNVYWHAIGRWK